jgi:uncharacterized membrane protein YraQ (UPF0718 family)
LPIEAESAAAPMRRLETFLGIFLLLAILTTFWTQQRYPALLGKLHSGSGISVHGAISFDAILPVKPGMPLPQRILRTSINWLWTNRLGMFFAIPFGAAMMTLMAQGVRPKRFASAAGNVLCGAVAGAPLGVCTNCATPIGQSLLIAGASTRLTVAAMISSPSFNPVVVAMAFLLFPVPLALLRVAVPLALLLLLPILIPENQAKSQIKTLEVSWERKTRRTRMGEFARQFVKNLLRVSWLTLPWMLLAALLGALAAELIPAYGTHLHASVLSIVLVAVLGTLLPVPMALDVALAFVLYRAGAPPALVVTLLCTLGPVSVYSLSALARQLGRDSMFRLAGATMALGTAAGLGILMLQ